MANKTGKKGKKPLQTTLGKASNQNEKEVDLSHVQKPIHTSIFGLRQVLSLFQTATEEVQHYITYECDIMYECRTCRTIFRSLANFILHKRNYCRERFSQLDILNNNEPVQETDFTENTQSQDDVEPQPITPEHKESTESACKEAKKDLTPIIEKLKERQEIHQLAQEALNEDLSKEAADDLNNLDYKQDKSNDLLLEKIATNNAAVFQTMLQNLPIQPSGKSEYMKSEVMEIHGILDSDEAVLGPDGKICTFETSKINENPVIPKGDLFCTECNLKFSTKKTLTYHIKYKHNNTRLVYVCPDCKDSFANAWCVYRHLYKIHRRTSAQIKRMREQIHNGCIRKDQEPAKKKDRKSQEKIEKTDEENQWLNNIEGDNDFQMCGGCGKRFERKAALHSHAQMCIKRIAVCNTIKENNAKKKEEECKENKNKIAKVEKPVEVLKGSSKRKPYLLRTYRPNDKISIEKHVVLQTEEVHDVNANCEILETNCDNRKSGEEGLYTMNKARKSSSTEDQLSPAKIKNISASPTVEKIDTEKMLNIIGVTSISENSTTNNESEETQNSQKKCIENTSGTVTNFDLFCQNIAKQLTTEREPEKNLKKTGRTIPLILRRRNSSKPEKKRNVPEENRKDSVANKILEPEPNKTECKDTGKVDVLECENVQMIGNESQESENLPSTSTFRISVKSLEDLIGVSTEDHIKNSEVPKPKTPDGQAQNVNIRAIRDINLDQTFSEVSDTVKANVSPEKLKKKFAKSLKRKRTASFDYTERNKSSNQTETEPASNERDISFISKASPYMDQDKLLCIPCQLTYTSLSKLLWHMSAHFSWFRFQCSRCSFISFNKLDCATHARRNHSVKKRSLQSVVLPIPNWKTVLMSHDFCVLKDENDLSGKHTDEIIFGNQEEPIIENIKKKKDDDGTTDWYDNLFVDSKNVDSEPENYGDFPLDHCNVKQESINLGIDIIDDVKDSFQIEVPQEIYTLDVSEIINSVDDMEEERLRLSSHVKIEKVEHNEEMENCYMPAQCKNEVDKIKVEVTSDDEIPENVCTIKREESAPGTEISNFKKIPECIVNIRPTRNRMRSIKTLQEDFFYDLGKVIKLNDSSVNKPVLQKPRKNNSNTSQKIARESVSSGSKNETKSLRVYSKRK